MALKKPKRAGFFLLRMNPQNLIKCTDLALHITPMHVHQQTRNLIDNQL